MKKVEHLLDQFVPEHYILELKPDLKKMTFTGEVEIKGIMPKPSKVIMLHSHGLELDDSTFSIGGGDHPVRGVNLLDKDEIQLNSPSEIHGIVTLKLKFHGRITPTMVGMYPSTSKSMAKNIRWYRLSSKAIMPVKYSPVSMNLPPRRRSI